MHFYMTYWIIKFADGELCFLTHRGVLCDWKVLQFLCSFIQSVTCSLLLLLYLSFFVYQELFVVCLLNKSLESLVKQHLHFTLSCFHSANLCWITIKAPVIAAFHYSFVLSALWFLIYHNCRAVVTSCLAQKSSLIYGLWLWWHQILQLPVCSFLAQNLSPLSLKYLSLHSFVCCTRSYSIY